MAQQFSINLTQGLYDMVYLTTRGQHKPQIDPGVRMMLHRVHSGYARIFVLFYLSFHQPGKEQSRGGKLDSKFTGPKAMSFASLTGQTA